MWEMWEKNKLEIITYDANAVQVYFCVLSFCALSQNERLQKVQTSVSDYDDHEDGDVRKYHGVHLKEKREREDEEDGRWEGKKKKGRGSLRVQGVHWRRMVVGRERAWFLRALRSIGVEVDGQGYS